MIIPIQPHQVAETWPLVAEMVESSVEETGSLTTAGEFKFRCDAGTNQLWLIAGEEGLEGCLITEVYPSPRGKTCGIPIAAGTNMQYHLAEVFEVLTAWAKEADCVRFEGVGRKGWVKALQGRGWRPVATIIEARI